MFKLARFVSRCDPFQKCAAAAQPRRQRALTRALRARRARPPEVALRMVRKGLGNGFGVRGRKVKSLSHVTARW